MEANKLRKYLLSSDYHCDQIEVFPDEKQKSGLGRLHLVPTDSNGVIFRIQLTDNSLSLQQSQLLHAKSILLQCYSRFSLSEFSETKVDSPSGMISKVVIHQASTLPHEGTIQ